MERALQPLTVAPSDGVMTRMLPLPIGRRAGKAKGAQETLVAGNSVELVACALELRRMGKLDGVALGGVAEFAGRAAVFSSGPSARCTSGSLNRPVASGSGNGRVDP